MTCSGANGKPRVHPEPQMFTPEPKGELIGVLDLAG
jgi:hypothetical protein